MVANTIYPYDAWQIRETSFDEETMMRDETIFSLGNGYIGYRGNLEEGYHGRAGTSLEGTYINGFYESHPIRYGEEAYGYARMSQTMLNVTKSDAILIKVDDEPFDLLTGTLRSYERVLDLVKGTVTRTMTWQSPKGRIVDVVMKRLVSLTRQPIAAFQVSIKPHSNMRITMSSLLDGDVHNQVTLGDPRVGSALSSRVLSTIDAKAEDTFGVLVQQTKQTQFQVACAVDHHIHSEKAEVKCMQEKDCITVCITGDFKENESLVLEKYVAYQSDKTHGELPLATMAKEHVLRAKADGFQQLCEEQAAFLARFWQVSDAYVDGDLRLTQSLRFHAFHLMQSVGRDGKTNIGAKGLTGEGYEGHYFWDTETYIFPFFLYTNPEIAKNLLSYRYSILDKARDRAKEMAQKGALFAWRTIDGEETSAYYPAGTAAYHINADVMYALKKYSEATNDQAFMREKGAEMLFETARLWVDLGDYIPAKGGCFCLNEVTGPDEYTALVNNNLYTNMMAKDHLQYAVRVARDLIAMEPEVFLQLADKIHLELAEIDEWERAANAMYIPYDETLGIHPQDDSFLQKAVWDFANTRPEQYPLLLHFHPLVIYRYQVIKQADVVLALYLQSEAFSFEEKRRNFMYYEKITTHDSSLSPCIHSIIAAEIGELDKAYAYFERTARMDLDDVNGNVKDGIHTASMGGTWLALVAGFGGFREAQGKISFRPTIPRNWKGYAFSLTWQERIIHVDVRQKVTKYSLVAGPKLKFIHHEQEIELTCEHSIEMYH